MNKKQIHLDTIENDEVEILYGEIELMNLLIGNEFDFVSGTVIGKGKLIDIKKIHVECDAMMNVSVDEAKRIVKYAETMDNAEVDNNVYNYLKQDI